MKEVNSLSQTNTNQSYPNNNNNSNINNQTNQTNQINQTNQTNQTNNTASNTQLYYYDRPGPIENVSLLEMNNGMELKSGLIEHHDYVIVNNELWRYLFAWYRADWSIVRYLRFSNSN